MDKYIGPETQTWGCWYVDVLRGKHLYEAEFTSTTLLPDMYVLDYLDNAVSGKEKIAVF